MSKKQTQTQANTQRLASVLGALIAHPPTKLEVRLTLMVPGEIAEKYEGMDESDFEERLQELLALRHKRNTDKGINLALPNEPGEDAAGAAEVAMEEGTFTDLFPARGDDLVIDVCGVEEGSSAANDDSDLPQKLRDVLDENGKSYQYSYASGVHRVTVPELGKDAVVGEGDSEVEACIDFVGRVCDKSNHAPRPARRFGARLG